MLSLLFWKLDDSSVAPWHSFALHASLEAVYQDYSLFLGQIWITREEGFLTFCKTDHVHIVLVTCFNVREGWVAAERNTSAQALHRYSCGGDVREHKSLSRKLRRYNPPLQHRSTSMYMLTFCETKIKIRKKKPRSAYKWYTFPPKLSLLDQVPFTSTPKLSAELFDRWGTGSVTLGLFLLLCLCIIPVLPLSFLHLLFQVSTASFSGLPSLPWASSGPSQPVSFSTLC